MKLSVVLPAKNEAAAIRMTVLAIHQHLPHAQVLIVNDGSTDVTAHVAEQAGARVITHPYSKGNGAAIKSGARAAAGDVIVFMDADGQHTPPTSRACWTSWRRAMTRRSARGDAACPVASASAWAWHAPFTAIRAW